ncbi:MAG TPA: hypothetical protein VME41_02030 [Stellaceae bacterium]|nr:hypothetical protein [Stellaceae bacterium]
MSTTCDRHDESRDGRARFFSLRWRFPLHPIIAFLLAGMMMTAALDVIPASHGGDFLENGGPAHERVVSAARDGGEVVVDLLQTVVEKWRHQMQHSCVLLALMVAAYLWHALLELLEEQGYLDEWLKDHPTLRRDLFAIGAILLLAPAVYYGSELHDMLYPLAGAAT